MSKRKKKSLEDRRPICIRTMQARGDLSQEEVASGLGIEPGAYNKYETRSPLRQDLIAPFCDITGTNERWLLTGEGNQKPDKFDIELRSTISKMEAARKKKLLQMAKIIQEEDEDAEE